MKSGPATSTPPRPVSKHVRPACPTPVARVAQEMSVAEPSPLCSCRLVTLIVDEPAILKARPDADATVSRWISSWAPAPTTKAGPSPMKDQTGRGSDASSGPRMTADWPATRSAAVATAMMDAASESANVPAAWVRMF